MKRNAKTARVAIALMFVASPAAADPKPLITYFEPMPIVGKLSTTVWGAGTVGARDPANGLEDDGADGGVGPQQESYFYWDGKILKGEDAKYHLYNSHWLHSTGFGAPAGGNKGWGDSIPMEAISDSVMGPYAYQNDCYTRNEEGNSKGHNVTAIRAPSGASPYSLSVTAIIPAQMFGASSSNGPWTLLGYTQANANGHGGCGTLTDNFTITIGPDNRFWATGRAGCVMTSDNATGSYVAQTGSVLPDLEHNDNGNAEDEVIWYSGGYYHIVFNYWNFQRAYHIMSKDGVTNWTSTGPAYQARQTPSNSYSGWLRYTDGTVNQWDNMERPGVYQENGHVTYFTFAVTDVNKNVTGINQGGSKILVVPFNGVQFDCDNGDPTSCDEAVGADAGEPSSSFDGGGLSDSAAGSDAGMTSGCDATVSDGSGGVDATASEGAESGARDAGTPATPFAEAGDAGGAGGEDAGESSNLSKPSSSCGCKTAGGTDSTEGSALLGGAMLASAWIHRRRRAHHVGHSRRAARR